eukprot:5423657-Prymnesium_polylepis.2
MNIAVAPIIEPTAIEPTASKAALPVRCVRPMDTAATPTPTTATESSSSCPHRNADPGCKPQMKTSDAALRVAAEAKKAAVRVAAEAKAAAEAHHGGVERVGRL